MKSMLIIFTCFYSIICFAEEWNLIGPADVKVYNYIAYPQNVLCTEKGLFIDSSGVWKNYSNGDLPIRDALSLNYDSLLVIMGCGSNSDGLYIFDVNTKSFHLVTYLLCPYFIHRPEESMFSLYVGSKLGCIVSMDGKNWDEILTFSGKECYAMTSCQGHYVISTSDGVYYSAVFSSTWYKSENLLTLIDLTYDWRGNFYGIYNKTRSAGLWVSKDYGETWSIEFFSQNMSAVYFNCDKLFVGWVEEWCGYKGVAIWDTLKNELHFINKGLPDAAINKFTTNDLIECINIICCTDSGVYISYNFEPSGIKSFNTQTVPSKYKLFQNYPNPFNPTTKIDFTLSNSSNVELSIYNQLGQKVRTLLTGIQKAGYQSLQWDGRDNKGNFVTSGVYIYKLKAGNMIQSKKMLLIR